VEVLDGDLVAPYNDSIRGRAHLDVSPFISIETMNRNLLTPGLYRIPVSRPDGYFCAALPPGRYYVVDIITPSVGGRTYEEESWAGKPGFPPRETSMAMNNPVVITLDVPPALELRLRRAAHRAK
jgi:hypothetical protein